MSQTYDIHSMRVCMCLCMSMCVSVCVRRVRIGRDGGGGVSPIQNNRKNLDPSETDLDFWDYFGRSAFLRQNCTWLIFI